MGFPCWRSGPALGILAIQQLVRSSAASGGVKQSPRVAMALVVAIVIGIAACFAVTGFASPAPALALITDRSARGTTDLDIDSAGRSS